MDQNFRPNPGQPNVNPPGQDFSPTQPQSPAPTPVTPPTTPFTPPASPVVPPAQPAQPFNSTPEPTPQPAPQVFSPASPPTPTADPAPAASPAPSAAFHPNPGVTSGGPVPPVSAPHTQAPVGPDEPYVSNPFFATTNGLIKILQVNPGAAILSSLYVLLVVLLAGILSIPLMAIPVLGVVIGIPLFIVLFSAAIGMFYVIAASSLKDEKVSVSHAFNIAVKRVLPFIGLGILTSIMVILGLILLIIPGIYLACRLALAPIALFEENLGPIAAIKRSFELTKGHTLEMLGALFAGGIMSGDGLLGPAITIAPLVGRYQGLETLKRTGAPKPPVHPLNWILPLVTVVIIALYAVFAITMVNDAANDINNSTTPSSQTQDFSDDVFDSSELEDSTFDSQLNPTTDDTELFAQ